MILLSTTTEERECASCQHCGAKVFISCISIIDTLPKLGELLDDTLNSTTCARCGESVTADVPVWINMEPHGLESLFYIPLYYLESGCLDPAVLSDPGNTNYTFYSRSELARQVRARILIHRLPIKA